MDNKVSTYLARVRDALTQAALRPVINALADRYSCVMLSSAGLAIKAGASAVVKSGASAFYALANGVLVTKGAATDMAALSGTVTNAKFNVFAFFIDSAGTLTSAMGTEGAALANVVFPPTPQGKTCVGFIVVNPTGTGNFVGGSTALDDATVAPNVVYQNPIGAWDPNVQLGVAT